MKSDVSYDSVGADDDKIMIMNYSLDVAGTEAVDIEYTTGGTNYVGTGSVTITEFGAEGEKITGTFSGTVTDGADTITITDGEFCVKNIGDE